MARVNLVLRPFTSPQGCSTFKIHMIGPIRKVGDGPARASVLPPGTLCSDPRNIAVWYIACIVYVKDVFH